MADLDAELLALAGGDSSDDEDSKPTITAAKAPFENPSPEASSCNKLASGRRGVDDKSTAKAGSGASLSKPTRKEDSEEEGEA